MAPDAALEAEGASVRLPASAEGVRFDRATQAALRAAGFAVSVTEVRAALRAGHLRVDGRKVAPGGRAVGGERVEVEDFVPKSRWVSRPRPDLLATNPLLALRPDWVALAKAPGLPTLPLRGPDEPSLLLAALAVDPQIGAAGPPGEGGAVHRLDNGTSGVVIFARNASARARLRERFAAHAIEKGYEALVRGSTQLPNRITAEIETTGGPRVRVRETKPADDAPASVFVELERVGTLRRVEARTRWGRRHQVRAHLAYAGHPILGDPLYAPPEVTAELDRLGLHARWIEIEGERIEVASGWEGLEGWRN
jgi:23S rRNA-/tRNA-specific pseudouridylate synthase